MDRDRYSGNCLFKVEAGNGEDQQKTISVGGGGGGEVGINARQRRASKYALRARCSTSMTAPLFRPTISPDFTGGSPIFSVFPQYPGSVT